MNRTKWNDGARGPVLCSIWMLGLLVLASGASAQTATGSAVAGEVFAGEEAENYLRLLQISGKSTPYPWSIRSFGPAEIDRIASATGENPWSSRFDFHLSRRRPLEIHLVSSRAGFRFNSGFPFGENDGAVWAGRGLTTSARAGIWARYGGLSLTIAPVAFWSQNANFSTVAVEQGNDPFADWRHPTQIDLPQRFGSAGYARVDPGQSTLRADVGPIAVGISTANQVWGPAAEFPLVLGTNAPGFPHVFAGTSKPTDLWIGKAHGRFVWGKLSQSAYSPAPADSSDRFMAGVVASFTPRGIPGLELGGGRFFHLPWPSKGIGWSQVLKPIETFTKVNLSTGEDHDTEIQESVVANQIASAFFRWVLPKSGFETYGEIASEDHRHNLRDFLLEPDHNTAYTLGLRKVFPLDDDRFWALRGELVSGTPSHLQRGRRQEPFYIHAHMRQGHTEEGQILGSPAAYGGSASVIAADLYRPDGRWTVSWRRTRRQQAERYLETGVRQPVDVQQGLGIERVLFMGDWDVTAGLDGIYEFDRDFVKDAVNVRASLTVQARLQSFSH